jgi:hypothetical protein
LRLRERGDRTAPSFGDGISRSGAILADDIRVRKEDDNTILLGMKQSHRQEKVQHTMIVSSIEIVDGNLENRAPRVQHLRQPITALNKLEIVTAPG